MAWAKHRLNNCWVRYLISKRKSKVWGNKTMRWMTSSRRFKLRTKIWEDRLKELRITTGPTIPIWCTLPILRNPISTITTAMWMLINLILRKLMQLHSDSSSSLTTLESRHPHRFLKTTLQEISHPSRPSNSRNRFLLNKCQLRRSTLSKIMKDTKCQSAASK